MSRRAVVMSLPKGVSRVVDKRTGKEYWYHQERRGKPDAGPRTTLPEYGTSEFWKALGALTGETHAPTNTVATLIETYKAQPEWLKHRPNTIATYEAALAHIKAAWGDQDPAGLTVAHIMAMRAQFGDRPSMGNMVLVQIRALMMLAVQTGLRKDNPAREVKALDEDPDEAKPLTVEAWQAITADEAPEALRRLAILGRATGQRISDLILMRPADRDQDGIVLKIKKLGDQLHWCPLRSAEIATIDGWKQFRAATYITDEAGRRLLDDGMRKIWKAFIATAAGKPLAGFTPHDLRATKVCDERIRGKSHQQIAAMVGMSIGMVTKYSRHIDQRLAARGTPAEQPFAKSDNQ
jgi:integrase